MFNITLNAKDFGYDPVAIAQFMRDVQSAMPQKQKENTSNVSDSADTGPLSTYWTNLTSRRIRRTEGRSSEEQAEHNLRSYKGYSDEDIEAVKNGTFAEKVIDSDEESVTLDEEDEEPLTDKDLF